MQARRISRGKDLRVPTLFSARGVWFGSRPLRHEPFAQRGLTLADVREDRLNVEIEFRRQHFAGAIDFRDNRIFPHTTNLP
jgi:hypothetical protein